ncbi:Sentrin-specific protease 6 [Nucella lapillus]
MVGEESESQPDTDASSTTEKEEECVLGRVISTESALQSQPDDYKLGLKQPCILVMDSLMGPSRNSIIKILKEYLQVEWDLKKGTPHDMMSMVRGDCPRVPQQNNFSDCGVYVLQYAESFFDNPLANYALPMKLERWFPRSQVARKREEIHDLILNLREELDAR